MSSTLCRKQTLSGDKKTKRKKNGFDSKQKTEILKCEVTLVTSELIYITTTTAAANTTTAAATITVTTTFITTKAQR